LRCKVAHDIGLGLTKLPREFHWLPLDFGWSLADVLQKSRDAQLTEQPDGLLQIEDKKSEEDDEKAINEKNEANTESNGKEKAKSWLEIGTWSNDLVPPENDDDDCDSIIDDMIAEELPSNLTMLSGGETLTDGPAGEDWGTGIQSHSNIRYGSPTIMPSQSSALDGGFGTFNSYSDYNSDEDFSELSDEMDYVVEQETTQSVHPDGLRIEFKGDHVAEAFDDGPTFVMPDEVIAEPEKNFIWDWPDLGENWEDIKLRYEDQVKEQQKIIMSGQKYLPQDVVMKIERKVVDFGPENIHRHPKKDSCGLPIEEVVVENSSDVIDATAGPVMLTPRIGAGEIHDETTRNKTSNSKKFKLS